MKMNAELLYQLLHEQYPVCRLGQRLKYEILALPIFYLHGDPLSSGKVYITRVQDMPQICTVNCLFICIGNRPMNVRGNWGSEVFYMSDRTLDLLSLLNIVNNLFDKINSWSYTMQELLERNADIEEFVIASIPVFENCITITDYDLRVLVSCDAVETAHDYQIKISKEYNRVPDQVSSTFMNSYPQYIKLREPFTYKGQREDPEGDNYCINLHLGDMYIGSCTLWNKLRPMRESDFLLFQKFSEYIHRLLSVQSRTSSNQLVTIKSIFSDLLQCYPVSRENLKWAIDLMQKNMTFQKIRFGHWRCIVIQSANKNKTLPESYLCTSLEDMLPHCTAITADGLLVCFCMIPEDETYEKSICDIIDSFLRDMNFREAISDPFSDIFRSRDYYLQATTILKTGLQVSPIQNIYRFADYVLPYMLSHCLGSFEPDTIISQGLWELQEMDTGVNYINTLRHYLDNECNASLTAKELYIHRSSLISRIEKIKAVIDLDTPEQRLYLRMCLYLKDYLEQTKGTRK